MSETKDGKRIVGKFFFRFVILGIIFFGLAFVLETWIPIYAKWGLDSRRVIFQSVVSIIATLCTVYFSISFATKGVKYSSKEEANKTIKPIKTLLVFFALATMCVGLLYCIQIERSEIENFEHNLVFDEDTRAKFGGNRDLQDLKKHEIHLVANIMLATKEIMTVLAYGYAVVYAEKMILADVDSKAAKKEAEVEEDEEEKEDEE